MPVIYNQTLGFWMDAQGATCDTFTTMADQTTEPPAGPVALTAAMKGLSAAKLIGTAVQYAKPQDVAAAASPYGTVADRVVFLLRYEGSRQVSRIEIPAPLEEILLPGHRYVDMENPLVVAFVAQMLAVAGDREGRPVVIVEQGRRQFVNRGPF